MSEYVNAVNKAADNAAAKASEVAENVKTRAAVAFADQLQFELDKGREIGILEKLKNDPATTPAERQRYQAQIDESKRLNQLPSVLKAERQKEANQSQSSAKSPAANGGAASGGTSTSNTKTKDPRLIPEGYTPEQEQELMNTTINLANMISSGLKENGERAAIWGILQDPKLDAQTRYSYVELLSQSDDQGMMPSELINSLQTKPQNSGQAAGSGGAAVAGPPPAVNTKPPYDPDKDPLNVKLGDVIQQIKNDNALQEAINQSPDPVPPADPPPPPADGPKPSPWPDEGLNSYISNGESGLADAIARIDALQKPRGQKGNIDVQQQLQEAINLRDSWVRDIAQARAELQQNQTYRQYLQGQQQGVSPNVNPAPDVPLMEGYNPVAPTVI